MKHLAAYLLLGLGGNASPSAEDIKTVLSAVGIEADEDRLAKLISELEGKDISEVRRGLFLASPAEKEDREEQAALLPRSTMSFRACTQGEGLKTKRGDD
ncbi:60S acidic ribosomal protein P2 [Claviceps africana]|uniref:60S acidic ribosomal protein P2 n=1 Tax=Claviceps africana TaxID=83212 RepID=A0A8K0J943_9HYPO|nr:60S acidic ribosomal protein P2 [Claviceps africana]